MIRIHFERSEACAEAHRLDVDRITVEFNATEGSFVQLTYGELRTHDGSAMAAVVDDVWWYDGKPWSDVVIEFVPDSEPEVGDPCPECGAELEWDEDERMIFCPNAWSHG